MRVPTAPRSCAPLICSDICCSVNISRLASTHFETAEYLAVPHKGDFAGDIHACKLNGVVVLLAPIVGIKYFSRHISVFTEAMEHGDRDTSPGGVLVKRIAVLLE